MSGLLELEGLSDRQKEKALRRKLKEREGDYSLRRWTELSVLFWYPRILNWEINGTAVKRSPEIGRMIEISRDRRTRLISVLVEVADPQNPSNVGIAKFGIGVFDRVRDTGDWVIDCKRIGFDNGPVQWSLLHFPLANTQ